MADESQREATFAIAQVAPEATYPLRQSILRPHQRIDEVFFAGDDDVRATHLGAIDTGGTVIGVASLLCEPAPWSGEAAWRLRGMAIVEHARRQGVGAALLVVLTDVLATRGGGTLWCAARVGAEGFYLRQGFTRVGEEWDEPEIGRHVSMWRVVLPSCDPPH